VYIYAQNYWPHLPCFLARSRSLHLFWILLENLRIRPTVIEIYFTQSAVNDDVLLTQVSSSLRSVCLNDKISNEMASNLDIWRYGSSWFKPSSVKIIGRSLHINTIKEWNETRHCFGHAGDSTSVQAVYYSRLPTWLIAFIPSHNYTDQLNISDGANKQALRTDQNRQSPRDGHYHRRRGRGKRESTARGLRLHCGHFVKSMLRMSYTV